MSFFDNVVQSFRSFAYPSQSATDWGRNVEAQSQPTASGISVGPDKARTLVAVWACQSLIADGIASLPVDVFRPNGKGRKQIDPPTWLKTPNPFETPYSFWHKLMTSLLGEDGNAYILVQRKGTVVEGYGYDNGMLVEPGTSTGDIVSLWILDPQRCRVDEHSATPTVHYNGVPFGPDEIMHIPAFTIPGRRAGISVIDNAREAIGLGLAAEEFGARFFGQGTTMSGIIEHPGKASPGEVALIGKMMRKKNGGLANSHAIGVLSGGATFKPISVNPDQAQFLETRRFQNTEIAALYRIPPHMIDPSATTTWGKGIEEQNKFFADYTLVPWLTRLEQAFSRLLPGSQIIKFNVDARLRAKTIERYQSYVMAVNNGIMTLDEVRAIEDLDPVKDGLGDKHYMPANLTEVGKEPPVVANPAGGVPANGGMEAGKAPPPIQEDNNN